ncbi:MAG TPA: hypothetical protein VEN81_06515, partial [Planctomycetota bacterium]|nr:hypothetical protein [Planctomycetota bacterium]
MKRHARKPPRRRRPSAPHSSPGAAGAREGRPPASSTRPARPGRSGRPDRALDLHREALVVDGHADTIGRFLDDGEDLGTDTGRGHLDLPRMIEGGLDAQFLSCWVEPKY